ncbi:MAG: sensor histidine kinase [Arenicella sp.]|nr:sensor histidine kinase [Arenicella sp.]
MTSKNRQFPIPDICRNTSILLTIVIVELFAVVVTLLVDRGDFLIELGKVSIYLQWCILLSAAVLCHFRKQINRLSFEVGAAATGLIGLATFILVEVISQISMSASGIQGFDNHQFMTRLSIVLIVIGMLLWGLLLSGRIESSSRAQAQAKVQALQSRIRPHFLFNSLNTISELAATRPADAESAIDSLSLLFRASLENVNKSHSLQGEIDLCERYLELERWRFGDGINFKKTIKLSSTQVWQVPKLILQPLIENAVLHGVDAQGSVSIELDIRETSNQIAIMVRNSKAGMMEEGGGNGMAIDNIRERLKVLYDDRQSLNFREDKDMFQVILRIPKQTHIDIEA